MIEIENDKNAHNYDVFDIMTDDGTFEISFQNNLDLYWRYIYKGSISKEPSSKTFIITKENYFLFSLLETLYENIEKYHPFGSNKHDLNNYYEKTQKHDIKNSQRLFKNGVIDWHSDDDSYEEASSVQIKKLNDDEFFITFNKSKTEDIYMTYSVRFSNSGSRYGYFYIPFMTMYNNLKKYDKNNKQIHMEEYLFNQKRLIKK